MGAHDVIAAPKRLDGPDLALLPTLDQQLARLDAALGDPDAYAEEWNSVVGELSSRDGRFGGQLYWAPADADDAEPRLYCGIIACDDQWAERRIRNDALREHLPQEPEYREAIQRLLLRLGHFTDNRRAPLAATMATVRGLLESGGRLMLNPGGRLEVGGGWPVSLEEHDIEAVADAKLAAMMAFTRLQRRWKARPAIIRAIKMLGRSTNNGWLVLEGRS